MIHADITPEQRAILNGKSADAIQVGGEHYKTMPIEPWEVMRVILTPEEYRGFLKGSYLKCALLDIPKEARNFSEELKKINDGY